ncbi:hypothetical protein ACRAWD_02755 [Caulobacter segnis]
MLAGFVAVDPANERQIDAARQAFPNYETGLLQPALARKRACVLKAEQGVTDAACLDKPDPRMSEALNTVHVEIHRKPAYQRAAASNSRACGADSAARSWPRRSGRSGPCR